MATEGNLQAPTRHPLDWKSEEFYNQDWLDKELERVFDICHGCRRCVSLCASFPTLFDLVDNSATLEVEVGTPIRGVAFGIGFNATNGQRLLSCDSDFSPGGEFSFARPGTYTIEIVIPSLPLTPSAYTLDVGCRTSGRMLDEIKSFALFEVVPSETTPQNELGFFPTVCFPSIWRCPSHVLELL